MDRLVDGPCAWLSPGGALDELELTLEQTDFRLEQVIGNVASMIGHKAQDGYVIANPDTAQWHIDFAFAHSTQASGEYTQWPAVSRVGLVAASAVAAACAIVSSRPASFTSTATTRAPSATKRAVAQRPMPEPAPVTMMDLFLTLTNNLRLL